MAITNTQGEIDDMCGGSPLIVVYLLFFVNVVFVFHVGEIHRSENKF